MKREWRLGDIAMIQVRVGLDHGIARYTHDGWRCLDDNFLHAGSHITARPLAVIDPEDRKAVERLTKAYHGAREYGEVTAHQVALREFANPTPPKPDEPTGLGAVVEDDKGLRWIRWSHSNHTFSPWRNVGAVHIDTGDERRWADIAAVRVLSEGVTR